MIESMNNILLAYLLIFQMMTRIDSIDFGYIERQDPKSR